MTSAFADPAKYELYDCKQLETERKNLRTKAAELQGLIAKANTGVAGPVVAELAYRNEYVAVRGQSRNAEEAWRRNKCVATAVTANVPATAVKSRLNTAKVRIPGPAARSISCGTSDCHRPHV